MGYQSITVGTNYEPINPTMKGWVHVDFNKDVSEAEIKNIIKEAYNIIKAKYTKKH